MRKSMRLVHALRNFISQSASFTCHGSNFLSELESVMADVNGLISATSRAVEALSPTYKLGRGSLTF